LFGGCEGCIKAIVDGVPGEAGADLFFIQVFAGVQQDLRGDRPINSLPDPDDAYASSIGQVTEGRFGLREKRLIGERRANPGKPHIPHDAGAVSDSQRVAARHAYHHVPLMGRKNAVNAPNPGVMQVMPTVPMLRVMNTSLNF
jgi:hypothetical protein